MTFKVVQSFLVLCFSILSFAVVGQTKDCKYKLPSGYKIFYFENLKVYGCFIDGYLREWLTNDGQSDVTGGKYRLSVIIEDGMKVKDPCELKKALNEYAIQCEQYEIKMKQEINKQHEKYKGKITEK